MGNLRLAITGGEAVLVVLGCLRSLSHCSHVPSGKRQGVGTDAAHLVCTVDAEQLSVSRCRGSVGAEGIFKVRSRR